MVLIVYPTSKIAIMGYKAFALKFVNLLKIHTFIQEKSASILNFTLLIYIFTPYQIFIKSFHSTFTSLSTSHLEGRYKSISLRELNHLFVTKL